MAKRQTAVVRKGTGRLVTAHEVETALTRLATLDRQVRQTLVQAEAVQRAFEASTCRACLFAGALLHQVAGRLTSFLVEHDLYGTEVAEDIERLSALSASLVALGEHQPVPEMPEMPKMPDTPQ